MDPLAASLGPTGGNEPVDIVADVWSANDDGTVNIVVRGTVVPAKALSGYLNRRPGDRVLVRVRGGQYVVQDRFGAAVEIPTPLAMTRSDLAAPSGQGWEEIITGQVWAKDNALWLKRVAPVPAPSTGTRLMLSRTATDVDTYREGKRLFRSYAEQGDYSGHGAQTGVWVFGVGAWAPLAGKTIVGLRVTMSRTGAGGGSYGPIPVRLYTHTATALPDVTPAQPVATPTLGSPHSPGSLASNQTATFDFGSAGVSYGEALRDGAAEGFAVFAAASRAENAEFSKTMTVHVDYLE